MAVNPLELLALARDERTPAAELERIVGALLAKENVRARDPRDREVFAAVASNPNAPPSLLFSLAGSHTQAVLSNPSLPLLLLENPSLVASAPEYGLRMLLAQPAAPLDWFEPASRHASHAVRQVVAGSRRAPPSTLARLADDPQSSVRVALSANPRAPAVALLCMGRRAIASDKPAYVRFSLLRSLASNPSTPLSLLESIADDPSHLPSVAGNPALPEALVEALASHESADVRAAVAARADLPPRLVRRLAADASAPVRAVVAGRSADPALLARLSLAPEGLVRRALLDNPHTPPFTLERLANAPVARYRTAARQRLAKQAAPRSP